MEPFIRFLICGLPLVLSVSACSDDADDGGACTEGTFDIPSLEIAEEICDPDGANCTVCEEEHDDAGAVLSWSVFTEDCTCADGR
jgi:hypothetical protein